MVKANKRIKKALNELSNYTSKSIHAVAKVNNVSHLILLRRLKGGKIHHRITGTPTNPNNGGRKCACRMYYLPCNCVCPLKHAFIHELARVISIHSIAESEQSPNSTCLHL